MPGRVRITRLACCAAVPSTWMNFVGVSALPADSMSVREFEQGVLAQHPELVGIRGQLVSKQLEPRWPLTPKLMRRR